MLTVKVTDLEPLESDLINLSNISFLVCINLDCIESCKYSAAKAAKVDMKILEDSSIRVMVMNGEDLYGCISFDKETDFTDCQGQEISQWITLFDDAEDDVYDGTLGEDDEEGPRVLV